MQLRHPRAAAGDGQVRSKAQLAQSRCHFSRNKFATYMAIYRSRWGAEVALQGARLRLSRAYLTFSAQPHPTDRAYENTSTEFDPSDCTWYAAEAAPILGGLPEGQDIGTAYLVVLMVLC
jgi:hypothetical protein